MMSDATRNLVDEARRRAIALYGEAAHLNEGHPQDTDQWEDAERLDSLAAALEAAQRPPVSPERQDDMAEIVCVELNHRSGGRECETDYAVVDAILARFSFPSQPVYDEEAIARFTADALRDDREGFGSCDLPRDFAAALVAALRGGELTREETNGG